MSRPKNCDRARERAEALRAISQMRIDDVYVIGAAGFWLGCLRKPAPRNSYSAASARREMLKRKIGQLAAQLGLDAEKIIHFLNQAADPASSSSSSSTTSAVAG